MDQMVGRVKSISYEGQSNPGGIPASMMKIGRYSRFRIDCIKCISPGGKTDQAGL
jgi:hypothetical protein